MTSHVVYFGNNKYAYRCRASGRFNPAYIAIVEYRNRFVSIASQSRLKRIRL